MSQNDFSLANANGATFRADVNSAFQAIASCSSGSSAPGTTYGCQWWFDTTNDILKIRDEANANWVNVASLVGTTWIPYSNGSVLGTLANQNASAIGVNLAMNAKSVAWATTAVSSGTPDFATAGNVVTLSSTATANTLGTVQAGFIGVIHYGVAITLTHNGTSRILPTGANITTASGDVEIVLSLGSGNWRTVSYMRADGTAVGAGSASQAQMVAASALTVFTSPGRQHHHPAHPKAFTSGRYSGAAPESPGTAYGVSSVSDTGPGVMTVNFSTAFATDEYVASGMCQRVLSNSGQWPAYRRTTDPTTTACAISFTTNDASEVDPDFYSVVFHGAH
jgi:hypothetical protein